MLAALRIMERIVDKCMVRVRSQHIPGEQNTIADDISRGWRAQAHARAFEIWGAADWPDPQLIVRQWAAEIHQKAKASRRSG